MKLFHYRILRVTCLLASLLLLSATCSVVMAKQLPLEENWIYLQDGQQALVELSFDPATDVLTVNSHEGEKTFSAQEVYAFSYGGYDYYSMPFNGGYSFFKVLYDGADYAVLHKSASLSLLEYFVKDTRGAVQICEDETETDQYVLCEQESGPGFGMPVYEASAVRYKLQDAIFLAMGDQVHLVSCKYDTEGQVLASVPSLQKKNKRLLKRLKRIVQNQDKMQALKEYAIAGNADLEDPEQLIMALRTVYP